VVLKAKLYHRGVFMVFVSKKCSARPAWTIVWWRLISLRQVCQLSSVVSCRNFNLFGLYLNLFCTANHFVRNFSELLTSVAYVW
jgi:hypothetical protein